MKTKQIIRVILNILIAACFSVIMVSVIVKNQTGLLQSSGFSNLKYYTVLSNLFEALASLIWVICAIVKRNTVSRFAERLKYIASVQVFVTFMVVVAFLAPIYGYERTCSGNNFWLHLAIPIAAVLEQIFLACTKMELKMNIIAVIPTLIYGAVYILNIVFNGKGEYPDINDWYGFLNWGIPIGAGIFTGISVMTFLLGLLLRGLWNLAHRKEMA